MYSETKMSFVASKFYEQKAKGGGGIELKEFLLAPIL
jgi:hypothetical protein